MLAGVLGIFTLLVILVMMTLGCVLLTGFVMAKSGFGPRVAVAAIAGPGMLLAPLLLIAGMDGPDDFLAATIGFGVLGAMMCGLIGWPVAHVATRRYDRLTKFDLGTFE